VTGNAVGAELAGAEPDAAGEAGDAAAGTEVAASAWRENTSKTVRIPAARIATCTAR
jgi:hypothetical protein